MSAPRPRDSAATRRALLAAGRALFAEAGYEHTTVRVIAERAGVNQALLFRYFGSKEGLFADAVKDDALDLLTAGPPEQLLDRILDATLAQDAATAAPFVAALRAPTDFATELQAAYTAAIAGLVETDGTAAAEADARLRAELLLAWLLGLSTSREITGPRADPAAVKAHLLRAAAALLTGPVTDVPRAP